MDDSLEMTVKVIETLQKVPVPNSGYRFSMEMHLPKQGGKIYDTLINNGYITVNEGAYIEVTEKGKAFAEKFNT